MLSFDLEGILLVIIAALLLPYVVVSLFLAVKGRKANIVKDYAFRPTVSIFLPTYNEEQFIEKKLLNLLSQTYPIHEILVYDCSTDQTPSIVRQYQKDHPNIRLISQPTRIGMARTLNEAFLAATGDIFIKTDCDSTVNSLDALKELVADFSSDDIGGAAGIAVSDKGIEKYLQKFKTIVQVAESNIDSTMIGNSLCMLAFRRHLVEPVNPNSMAEDTEETLLIRKKGYRSVVDPQITAVEEVPDNYKMRRMQKDRRAQGIIKVLFENSSMFFNPRYGRFGSIVMPLELFVFVLSPIILLSLMVVFAGLLYVIHPLLAVAALGVLAAAAIKRSNVIWAIIDTQLSTLVGTVRNLRKKDEPLWQKVR